MTTKHIHKQLKQQILTIIILYTFSLSIHSENTIIHNTHNNLNNSISYTSKQNNKTNTIHRTYNHYNNTNNINLQNITNNTTIQIKPASERTPFEDLPLINNRKNALDRNEKPNDPSIPAPINDNIIPMLLFSIIWITKYNYSKNKINAKKQYSNL